MFFIFHRNWRNSHWSISSVTSKFPMNQFDQKPYISMSKTANLHCLYEPRSILTIKFTVNLKMIKQFSWLSYWLSFLKMWSFLVRKYFRKLGIFTWADDSIESNDDRITAKTNGSRENLFPSQAFNLWTMGIFEIPLTIGKVSVKITFFIKDKKN